MKRDKYRVFIDTAPMIYFLDNNDRYKEIVKSKIEEIISKNGKIVISPITCMEYLTLPYKYGRIDCVNNFWTLVNDLDVDVCPIGIEIGEIAARIRGKYDTFKNMDAFQLACSKICGCEEFITNDRQLLQYEETKIVYIEELLG